MRCYVCSKEVRPLSSSEAGFRYGCTQIGDHQLRPLCVECLKRPDVLDDAVRKFLNAPNLKITDGGAATTEQLQAMSERLSVQRHTNAHVTRDLMAHARWERHGDGWRLMMGRRCFGQIVPDAKYPGMWRSIMPDGSLSDMANIVWSKHAVSEVARRELEYADKEAAFS
jgi:hypothetical protein